MTVRTTITTVTFSNPFVFGGLDEELPAGVYEVETEEELLEGISFPAYRRTLTIFHVRGRPGEPILTRSLTIDPKELDAAIERDQAITACRADSDFQETPPNVPMKTQRQQADRQDLDRADDEGMIIRQGRKLQGPQHPGSSALARDATEDMEKNGITRVPVDYFHYREFRYTNLEEATAQAQRDQIVDRK